MFAIYSLICFVSHACVYFGAGAFNKCEKFILLNFLRDILIKISFIQFSFPKKLDYITLFFF